ncbi:MAG: type II secretion system F family protein [Sedimentisphaerales bacterium]|nr:type II secretion system F family protein [Sedimentisphaerales bacterium]
MSAVKSHLLSDKRIRKDTRHKSYVLCHKSNLSASDGDIYKRLGTKELCMFTRQLAMLLKAGMPLVPALSALAEQFGNTPLSRIVEEIRRSVNSGCALADAIAKFPDVFSPVFVNMVAAGESSGTLEQVLLRLAEMLQKRVNLTGKVKAAIAYPVMMVVVAMTVLMFLLSFVVPSITAIFLEMNRELPWPTVLLINTCNFIKTYFVLIVVLIFMVFFAVAAWTKTKEGRLLADRFKLKLPLFGGLFLKLEIARLSRTLALLLSSGIPILSALEIVKGVIRNSYIVSALGLVKDLVSKGDDIAGSIRKTGLFPPIVVHVLGTCQMSGNVEDGLFDIADMYDSEVELTAKMLTTLLEPAVLILTGAIIGFIVLAVLLPIFEINQML